MKDTYDRIIECPKCGSHEINGEILWYPDKGKFVNGDYVCRVCNFRGNPIQFRSVPNELEESFNPSRR